MDLPDFRIRGKEVIDYVTDYLEKIQERRVVSDVKPGYLTPLLPKEAPQKPEDWAVIMNDVEKLIMPGITHWQHPQFHAYFPSGNSGPSILADIISDAIGCIGFSWVASPACTELETIVLDWFGKALNLPSKFLFCDPESCGGGVIQTSASECILVCMLAARSEAIKYLMNKEGALPGTESMFLPKLVAYCSNESHSCVEKNAMISLVKLRILEVDDHGSLRGETLREAIQEDIKAGLHPFFVSAILGSTAICSFDKLSEIGEIVENLPACWFHVDAAYAGSGFICPENQYLMEGIHYADSFNTNCNKWLTICYDCSCLWVKDRKKLTSALVVDPIYLQHANSDVTIDYRHWCIPLSRRFRALKLWFTFRAFGIEGLQAYIRNHCELALYFEKLVLSDDRFEICNEVKLGLVCFRLKGKPDQSIEYQEKLNQTLLSDINAGGKVHMIPCKYQGQYTIRFCVIYPKATREMIEYSWKIIQDHATNLLQSEKILAERKHPAPKKRISRKFSFIRSVSREIYETRQSRGSLHDGATPILIPQDEHTPSATENEDEDVFFD